MLRSEHVGLVGTRLAGGSTDEANVLRRDVREHLELRVDRAHRVSGDLLGLRGDSDDFITCVEEQRKAGSRVFNIWNDYPEDKRRECFHEANRGPSSGDYGVDGSYVTAEACLEG